MERANNKFRYCIIVLIIAVLYIFYLQYVNYSYYRQIQENNSIIDDFMLRDSISSELLETIPDSTGYKLVLIRNAETGKPVTYMQLDSMYEEAAEKAFMYEQILLSAKKILKFDYSYKIKGDTIIFGFWDKKYSKRLDFGFE